MLLPALVAVWLAPLQPGPGTIPGTITAAQLESTPPEEMVRRLFGDLSHIIFPAYSSQQVIRPPFGIRALHFYTRPYGAGLAGICQTDTIIVTFEPVPGYVRSDDPPVRPARIHRYDNSYFVADLARTRKREVDHEGSCSSIDPRTVPLIVASRSGEVVDAVADFADLIDSDRAGRATVQLDCQSPAGQALDQRGCLTLLARYRPERIHLITTVPGCGRGATDAYCHRIETSIDRSDTSFDDRSEPLQILFEAPRSDAGPMGPARVQVRPAPRDPDLGH
jgi:hypothetical protein